MTTHALVIPLVVQDTRDHETGSRVTDKEERSRNLRNKERACVRDNEYGGIVEQKRRDNGTEYR